ncbi:hypothetical protein ACW5XW_24245 [Aeromonas piscicola]|uniref:hypothetical protein n=1 Tax=Aeromonas piscicola TaxID=600645 RepID=UPI0005B511AE|nr:hypothetical protein [Aeromonas piscicola]
MNTQDNFINAVKEVKSYMYDRCQYLTDEQKVLIEGELTMFLTKAFIKQAEAEKKEAEKAKKVISMYIRGDESNPLINSLVKTLEEMKGSPITTWNIVKEASRMGKEIWMERGEFVLKDKDETYTEQFTRQLEQHRDLIQRLVKEVKSNRCISFL